MEQQSQLTDDDSISLIDLAATLLRHKKMITGITVLGMVVAVGISILSLALPPEKSFLPNRYAPNALMLINDSSSSAGGLSSMLSSSGLGGLASMAGVSLPSGSSYSDLAVYLVGTNSFLDAIVDKFGLIQRYKIKKSPRAMSRKALQKMISADFDKDSGVFSITFTDYDPAFAQQVVNFAVDWMEARFQDLGLDKNRLEKENLEKNVANTWNDILRLEQESKRLERSVSFGEAAGSVPTVTMEYARLQQELLAQKEVYKQLKVQYELVKVKLASETPVFQVLERAEIPDKKSEPSRGMICLIATFAAFFIAILLAFLMEALEKIRQDPESMSKLKGKA